MKFLKSLNKQSDITKADSAKDVSDLQKALSERIAEGWRFELALEKTLGRIDVMEAERLGRQYRYFSDKVRKAASTAGITCLDLTGHRYDIGMAVQAMNLEEFDEEEDLIISRMIEPVILCNGRVIKTGMVMLSRTATEI